MNDEAKDWPPAWWATPCKWQVGPFDDGQGGEVMLIGDSVWAHIYFTYGADPEP